MTDLQKRVTCAGIKINKLVGKIDKFNSCKKMQQFGKAEQLRKRENDR